MIVGGVGVGDNAGGAPLLNIVSMMQRMLVKMVETLLRSSLRDFGDEFISMVLAVVVVSLAVAMEIGMVLMVLLCVVAVQMVVVVRMMVMLLVVAVATKWGWWGYC